MPMNNCRHYVSPVSNTNIQQGRGQLSLTLFRLKTIFEIQLIFDVPVYIVLSKFSLQTRVTVSAFLYMQLPFLPEHAAKKPNSRSLPRERGKGCSSSPWCVRANINDSPAGVSVLWQRGCNPSLTPGDGFERADLSRSPGHFTNKQGSLHPHLCKLSMLTL